MMLPLYKTAEPHKTNESNVGLWFERFFNQFNEDASDILKPTRENPNQGNNIWLQKFETAGNTDALQTAAKQQLSLVNALNGKYKFFNTEWHFVTGTGYPHPVENGLLWHKTYGVPYLSGAAVKGLVRAWVEEWEYPAPEGESDEEKETRKAKKRAHLLNWFGSEDKQSPSNQAGDIIFFDAFPVQAVKLKTDIMTPHYGDWYSEGGKIKDIATEPEKIPADWHDPNPIPFLVVDSKTPYLFSVAPRNEEAKKRVNMDCVICSLINALEWLGAGAKTATGYGGFVKQDNHPLEKQWKAANQSFEDEIKDMTEKQLIDAFSKDYTATRKHYEQDWQQVIALIWQNHDHASRIESWANADKNSNKAKAYKKLCEEQP